MGSTKLYILSNTVASIYEQWLYGLINMIFLIKSVNKWQEKLQDHRAIELKHIWRFMLQLIFLLEARGCTYYIRYHGRIGKQWTTIFVSVFHSMKYMASSLFLIQLWPYGNVFKSDDILARKNIYTAQTK